MIERREFTLQFNEPANGYARIGEKFINTRLKEVAQVHPEVAISVRPDSSEHSVTLIFNVNKVPGVVDEARKLIFGVVAQREGVEIDQISCTVKMEIAAVFCEYGMEVVKEH